MNGNAANHDLVLKSLSWNDLSARALAKTIFNAELPEQFVRTIPAQSLYLTLQYNGISSSSELIEIVSNDQCKLLLDFDLWRKDVFDEDRIWEWLGLSDDTDGLELLQKIARNIDLKLIAILIARHVHVIAVEQPSETPPQQGYFTPDKGHTWLSINIEDQNHAFLFGRLLALIFESNADLFYQLLAIPNTSTPSVVEEEAFNDKNRRLSAEGIPDRDYAAELHRSISASELKTLLDAPSKLPKPEIQAVLPLVVDEMRLEPLSSLVESLDDISDLQLELTLIMNSALIRFGVELCEYEEVTFLCSQVRGAVNIGLAEALKVAASSDSKSVYHKLGLLNIYRLGLTAILPLRKLAGKITVQQRQDAKIELIYQALIKPFPATFAALARPDLAHEDAPTLALVTKLKPIESLIEIREIQRLIKSL